MQDFNYTLIANLYCPGTSVAPALQPDAVSLQESLVIQDSDISYYRKLRVAPKSGNNAERLEQVDRKLARVSSVQLAPHPERPELLQVHCVGVLSRAGLALDVPLITREGQEFSILLAEVTGAAELQTPVKDAYRITVPVDISGLDSGNYRVRVNGIERRFVVVD